MKADFFLAIAFGAACLLLAMSIFEAVLMLISK